MALSNVSLAPAAQEIFTQDISGALTESAGEFGVTREAVLAQARRAQPFLQEYRTLAERGQLPMFALPYREDDVDAMLARVAEWRQTFARLIVLGTGGSSLGGQALTALVAQPFAQPAVQFIDNVDPLTMDGLLAHVAWKETGFLVISKSGTTAETLAQTLAVLAPFRAALGDAAVARHFTFITVPGDNPLRRLAAMFSAPVIDHDPALGGRFSVMSEVGLLPAAMAGLDIHAVRRGAAAVLDAHWVGAAHATSDIDAFPAAVLGAGVHYALQEAGRHLAVLMPYSDQLAALGWWYRQGWAESLGKQGRGTTPIYARGAVDQHSQLQLYLDGPADKFITLLLPETAGQGPQMDGALAQAIGAEYLNGKRIGDVMDALAHGTEATLRAHHRPLRVWRLPRVDAYMLGALMMHIMLETVLTARLLDTNPFDQPAVEHGKQLARARLAAM